MNKVSLDFLNKQLSLVTGIRLDYYKNDLLLEAYSSVMLKNGIESYIDLGVEIKKNSPIVGQLFKALTVNYTSLFRGKSTWKFLMKELGSVPEPINILHLACSTGEEVLSMQILLNKLRKSSNISASDLDHKAIETAKSYCYNKSLENSFRNGLKAFDPSINFDSLFHISEKGILVHEKLQGRINWLLHDVIKPLPWEDQDIIFCRNMLIYLEEEFKTLVLDNIYKALKPNAWLILGNLDGFLIDEDDERFEIVDPHAKIYSKRS